MTIRYLIFGNGFIGNRFANFLQDSIIAYSNNIIRSYNGLEQILEALKNVE